MFWCASARAQEAGKPPVRLLLGPEEYAEFRRSLQYMMAQSTQAAMKGEPLKFNGMTLLPMRAPGVAVATMSSR